MRISARTSGRSGDAHRVVRLLRERGLTVGTAESLTGGLVCAALTTVPGSSQIVRGGVVAYATPLKAELLGVPAALLAERGAVDPEVALAMAAGARRLLGADVGLSCTGVAGPDPADGNPVGTVFVAVSLEAVARVRPLSLFGSREEIRAATVAELLGLAEEIVQGYQGATVGGAR